MTARRWLFRRIPQWLPVVFASAWSLHLNPAIGEPLTLSSLESDVGRLREKVTALAGTNDLAYTLHFDWFDRPYARATLALLVKTTAGLDREVRLRQIGNGAMSDRTVRSLLVWTGDAIDRVVATAADPSFRPHRLRLVAGDVRDGSAPSLFAFVDRATTTRQDSRWGDLDILAALGCRVYARSSYQAFAGSLADLPKDRAEALGMLAAAIDGADHSGPGVPRPAAPALPIETHSLAALLGNHPDAARGALRGVKGAIGGDSWSGYVARYATARGMLDQRHFATTEWSLPRGARSSVAMVRTAMWMSVLEGQQLGVVSGWRDLRDGSGSMHRSLILDPNYVEAVAHGSLDFQRVHRFMTERPTRPMVAVAIGAGAIDANGNRWAAWIEPIFAALIDRQIRFDVVNHSRSDEQLSARYAVVLRVEPDAVSGVDALVAGLEGTLASHAAHADRVVARQADGKLAANMLLRVWGGEDGSPSIAIVNLSDVPRQIHLAGRLPAGRLEDVLTGTAMGVAGDAMPMTPWQVRLLRAAD